MFSRLEPLFLRHIRQAETTDTRQAIREEHKEGSRNKNDRNQREQDEQDLWTDTTVVSVESLHAFLVGFLHEQVSKERQKAGAAADTPDFQQNSAPTMERGAANAYEATARRSIHPAIQPTEPSADNPPPIESEDVRRMNRLIQDLQTLSNQGIKELNIPRAGTFLESIQQAIEKAL